MTEKIEHAEAVIEYMRKKEVRGEVKCIVKEKQLHLNNRKQIQLPKGAVRLLDKIKITDSSNWCIFYYLFRDTLVAKDIDEALELSYRDMHLNNGYRWQVVTLDGRRVDASG